MPILGTESTFTTSSEFSFSGASLDHLEELGAPEYTLATLVVDESGSVEPFRADIEGAIQSAIESWKKHPRSEYLMVRMLRFNTQVEEVHGFRLLRDCDPSAYVGILTPSGMTALYEAVTDAIEATSAYALNLRDRDFQTNAITVIITDGLDNCGNLTGHSAEKVAEALSGLNQAETLESHITILTGVNVQEDYVGKRLEHFKDTARLDAYIELEDASPKTLARLGKFVAESVSSQSEALGTGGPSQILTF